MTIGELAGLIAALAFAALVIFLCINLTKILQILRDFNATITRVNTTIDVLTKDVDNLSIEVEGLLNKTNTLVDDLNGKLSKTDPLFVAIGDLGVTVSDLNESTKQMTSNLLSGTGKKKKSSPTSTISKIVKSRRKGNRSSEVVKADNRNNTDSKQPIKSDSDIFTIKNTSPSKTAGEITIE